MNEKLGCSECIISFEVMLSLFVKAMGCIVLPSRTECHRPARAAAAGPTGPRALRNCIVEGCGQLFSLNKNLCFLNKFTGSGNWIFTATNHAVVCRGPVLRGAKMKINGKQWYRFRVAFVAAEALVEEARFTFTARDPDDELAALLFQWSRQRQRPFWPVLAT